LADLAGLMPPLDLKQQMVTKLRTATRLDSQAKQERDKLHKEQEDKMRTELLTGKNANVEIQHYAKVSVELILLLRPLFSGLALRRTIGSKDNTGSPVWHLKAPIEITLLLHLTKSEVEVLEQRAQVAKSKSRISVKWRAVCVVY
jgi:hypothetical protein